mgnify:CR=1 FL=1
MAEHIDKRSEAQWDNALEARDTVRWIQNVSRSNPSGITLGKLESMHRLTGEESPMSGDEIARVRAEDKDE